VFTDRLAGDNPGYLWERSILQVGEGLGAVDEVVGIARASISPRASMERKLFRKRM
jgi:hypothetical protein